MPHFHTKLKQNKLIQFRDIKSLNNGLKCRKPVFMRVSGICYSAKQRFFKDIYGAAKTIVQLRL